MTIPKKEIRKFGLSDADMLEEARLTHSYFETDKVDMVAFDATMDDPFADDFLAEIDAVEEIPDDDIIIDELTESTRTVEEAMEAGRRAYQQLKYFIENAFVNEQTIWNQFGYNDYEKKNRSQASFIQFLFNAHKTSFKYATELNAVGCTNARIAEIKTLAEEIQTFNIAQESKKGTRPVGTESRIKMLNSIWSTLSRIRRAGKLIYFDNFGKYQRYLGHRASSSTNPVTGTVPASSVVKVISGGFVAETPFNFKNTGDTTLRFGLCQTATEIPDESGITLAPGESQIKTVEMLGDYDETHTFINVLNLSSEATGRYEVTYLE
ncbi:MAG: hypothetical protein IPM47_10555 [Sphingobacteriales bacterium]|nr:MAG: hypothetical protein IPM47_10555 [Sphingobacteriales bacterium]